MSFQNASLTDVMLALTNAPVEAELTVTFDRPLSQGGRRTFEAIRVFLLPGKRRYISFLDGEGAMTVYFYALNNPNPLWTAVLNPSDVEPFFDSVSPHVTSIHGSYRDMRTGLQEEFSYNVANPFREEIREEFSYDLPDWPM